MGSIDRRPLETGRGPCVTASGAEHGRPPSTYAARSGPGAHGAIHACMVGCHFVCTRKRTYTHVTVQCARMFMYVRTYVHAHGTTRRSSGAWVPCSRGRLLRSQVSSGSRLEIKSRDRQGAGAYVRALSEQPIGTFTAACGRETRHAGRPLCVLPFVPYRPCMTAA